MSMPTSRACDVTLRPAAAESVQIHSMSGKIHLFHHVVHLRVASTESIGMIYSRAATYSLLMLDTILSFPSSSAGDVPLSPTVIPNFTRNLTGPIL
jgi:hypothetical protein